MPDFVVVYSRTGKSRSTAQRLAKAVNAEVVEIVEERPKKLGFLGFMEGIFDSLFKRTPEIKSTRQIGTTDRVILCGPIWAGRIAGPIRTWLHGHGRQVGQLVWVPHSGASREWPKATAEISALAGHAPSLVFSFTERDFAKGNAEGKVSELAAMLKTPTSKHRAA